MYDIGCAWLWGSYMLSYTGMMKEYKSHFKFVGSVHGSTPVP